MYQNLQTWRDSYAVRDNSGAVHRLAVRLLRAPRIGNLGALQEYGGVKG